MNKHLVEFIDGQLNYASRYVLRYMPFDVDTNEAYEELLRCSPLCSEDMVQAFTNAARYLPPSPLHKRMNLDLPNGRVVSVQIRLDPSAMYPQHLMPFGSFHIAQQSKFYNMLAIPIKVAKQWTELGWVWNRFREADGIDNRMLGYLFPWLREVLEDFHTSSLPVEVKMAERRSIDREVATIMRTGVPNFFPSMGGVNAIAKSGNHLFAQYNLIRSTRDAAKTEAAIIVECTASLIDQDLPNTVSDVLTEWIADRRRWTEQQLDKDIEQANKRFDREHR